VKIRCSNTLADDEGVVFATNVPGSPIQVMGRRDPRRPMLAGLASSPESRSRCGAFIHRHSTSA
jgi:hypothetical protein